MDKIRSLLGSATVALGLLCGSACHRDQAHLADKLDFNWDVRPILSDNCFRCHGPDAKARKASLRLDQAQTAYAELPESPGKHAVVPGKPDASEVIRRITSDDPDVRMPPSKTNKQLSAEQIAILTKWVEDGAVYKPHWAFIAPEKATVPAVRKDQPVVNDIDHFVLARLQRENLQFSPEADRETLINRVSLTLTGLPPTLDEVDAFVNDKSPEAYERVIDRLLGSAAYAERMTAMWMNLARWADTDGYLDDHHERTLWPWRDWVISAFQKNMPYDQFATQQLAGDLLPKSSRDQILATAFLRLGKRTAENGAIDEEFRIEYVVDRTDTIGTTFLGLTVGCARCHDHKYDPIPQKDYYSMSGFFNSADEPGVYAPGHSGIQGGPTLPWPKPENEPKLIQADNELRERGAAYRAALDKAAKQARPQVAALFGATDDARAVKTLATSGRSDAPEQVLQKSLEDSLVAYYPFESTRDILDSEIDKTKRPPPPEPSTDIVEWRKGPAAMRLFNAGVKPPGMDDTKTKAGKPDVKVEAKAAGKDMPPLRRFPQKVPSLYARDAMRFSPAAQSAVPPAVIQEPNLAPGKKGNALFFTSTNKGYLGRDVGYYDRTQQFSLDFWFFPGAAYEDSVPVLSHRDDQNAGGAGYQLDLKDQKLVFYMAHSRPFNMLAASTKEQLPLKQWSHITMTYDGSSKVAGLKLYLNGKVIETDTIKDNLTQSSLPVGYGFPIEEFVGLSFGTRFREKAPVGSGLDEVRVYKRALTPIEVAYLDSGASALHQPARQLTDEFTELAALRDNGVVQARAALDQARAEQNTLVTNTPQVLVMADTATPRPTYRLERGVYNAQAEPVPVQGLDHIFKWDSKLPANRIGLAAWLFDKKNPLTARVFVNRIWQMHFGTGLVKTAEDFGSQGSIPTHPELLDWLAVQFMESGWDIKKLHKLIVMSATYRQSSDATEEAIKRDPENALLARGVRIRMQAEMVRDNALASAGLLVNTVGGKSVHPYQPENIWDSMISFYEYPKPDSIPADEQHRRSLYTFVKRNAMYPGMQLLDAADPNVSIARRRVSNTPLQSLLLLNDPQYEEAYRVLAQHALKSSADTDARLTMIFRLARRQRPNEEQLVVLRDYLEIQHKRFQSSPAAVDKVIKVGVDPADPAVDGADLAAYMNVTALVMNSPDSYFIR